MVLATEVPDYYAEKKITKRITKMNPIFAIVRRNKQAKLSTTLTLGAPKNTTPLKVSMII
jgi:hypothetical protein